MRKLIKADIQRILRKKSIWILFVFMIIFVTLMSIGDLGVGPDESFSFTTGAAESVSYIGAILGLMMVLFVYTDDFKSTNYINTIGRGFSRPKYVLTKFLVSMIISASIYIIAELLVIILALASGVHLTNAEVLFIVLKGIGDLIYMASSIAITSIFFFLTENGTIGVIVYLTVVLIIPVVLELIVNIPIVSNLHLNRYYLAGASSIMISDFIIGATLEGFLYLFIILAVYVGAALGISILVFRKKELEF